MRSNCKNYTVPGGDKTVIGGTLEIKQGATVTGLAADPLQPATAEALGGVIVGDGLAVEADGTISLDLTPAEAVADCEAEDVDGVVDTINALLASLRAAGLLAEESAD